MTPTLIDLYNYAEQAHIEVMCMSTRKVACMSIINEYGDCGIGINPFMLSSEQDERVKLAHEIGHFEMGAFYNLYSPLDVIEHHEYRANKWAIKKLIPKDKLINAYKNGICDNSELAEYFGITEDFLQIALKYYNEHVA